MFHRIQQYPLMSAEGRAYRPRAYGSPRSDETWEGWLVFFPVDGSTAIASDRETTQPSFHAVTGWALGLTDVYVAGALERALRIAEQPPILAELARAEYDALDDAEQLTTTAELNRASARANERFAASALADARDIRRERVAIEETEAAREKTAAAVSVRAVTEDGGRRRRRTRKG